MKTLLIFGLLTLVVACKKTDPEPESDKNVPSQNEINKDIKLDSLQQVKKDSVPELKEEITKKEKEYKKYVSCYL